MNKFSVLLADDHALMRMGLRALVDALPDAHVVAEAGNGHEAVALARQWRPAVAVLDIAMPQLNGIEAAERITREGLPTKVVILSMHATRQYVTAAIRAGAVGYVVKDAAVDELAQALRAAAQGRSYVSPSVSDHLLHELRGAQPGQEPQETTWHRLSARQREVLQLIAEGRSTREIGELLHISPKTVETHRAELMRRLDIHEVAGLTRFAIREGLISGTD
jgi:DNA-binding NarL/FixJ family response regulator